MILFRLSLLVFLGLLLSSLSPSRAQASQPELTVTFTGIEEVKGQLLIRITHENGDIKNESTIPVNEKKPSFSIKLPSANYGVSAFHDVNSNNKLDREFTGMPSEKYGFSNNARGTFSPPDLEETLINLDRDQSISIKLK